jgi:Flp pilus assembly CpaE family ATPase
MMRPTGLASGAENKPQTARTTASISTRTRRRASPKRYFRPTASTLPSLIGCCRNAAFEAIFDSLRATVPSVVLDVPHQWSGWTKQTLVGADDILIVAAPDLANLRNTKNLYDFLKTARPNDHRPLYCLNQVGVPKRPEIKASDFAKALDDEPVAVIPFEPQLFGSAANNGQMIAEISASHRTAEARRRFGARGNPRHRQ